MIPQEQLLSKMAPVNVPGLKMDWYHMYTNLLPGRSVALLAGRGELFSGTIMHAIPVSFCMAVQKPLDPGSLQQAGSWAGAPALQSGPEGSAYLFTETLTGRKPTTLAQMHHDFETGTGRQLITMSHPAEQASGIMIIAPVSIEK
jgi:hypothetical protein